MKQAVSWVANTALALIFVLWCVVLIAPRLWGFDLRTVLSGSMSPTFDAGSLVVIKPVEAASIKVNDVIAFRSPEFADGTVVTHRVVEVKSKGGMLSFMTKGDANEEPDDSLVPSGSVVGRVIFHIPLFGYVASFVRTPLGFILCLVIPAAIFIGGATKSIIDAARMVRREEQRKQATLCDE